MKYLNTILVLLAAFVTVFWQAAFNGVRHWLGAQIDFLPALMVYAALTTGLTSISLLAVLGGLWFDSLSANPLGVTVLPLFIIGLAIYANRDLILSDQFYAQLALGLGASAALPTIILILLLTTGHAPLFGWGTLWQFFVISLGGAIATPVVFALFSWLNRAFGYHPAAELSFRPDREIRRGR